MPRHLRQALFLVALLAGALGVAAPALAVDTPFSVRYAQTLRGSIDAVGNQLLTCPAAASGCLNARDRIGTSGTLNNNYNMGYVDVDGDASTLNSSTATLSLPAGATVTWAGLYWGADTAAGSGGLAAPDDNNRGSVRFKVDSGGYQTVTAAPADVLTSTGKASRYRAFANVTGLLPATGNATYGVGNVQTGRGDDRFAGWSLVVAYQDAAQDVHRVSVYDGLGTVDATHTFSTNITPFFTPEGGTVATKTGLLAFEGDTGIVGETATFNGTALTDAINGPGNLMNSTMAVDGSLFTAKSPNYGNLMGTDIDVWNSTGLLENHQSTATLAFASNQDLFVPSALWLVSDEGPAANTDAPTVGGVARDGSTLTADPGSWDGTPTITYEYQWQRCDAAGANCLDIPGETGTTYTLTPADVGSTIRVLVTAVNDAGSSDPSASVPSATITQLAPSNVTLPLLSGTQQDGQTLTTTIGGWDGTAPLDYDVQWQRCDAFGANCTDIPAATAWSYVLTDADIGSTVRSEVTATNDEGFATAVSAPTSTVDPAPPVNTTVPAVSGAVRDGQTLTADDGDWTGTDPIGYAHQWERCDAVGSNCTDIDGATSATYVLTGADIGHAVRVEVTATNVAGNAAASSSPTTAVIADPPANTVVPTLSGSATDGSTLTLDTGTWTGTGPLAYDVVWQRCDSAGANCVPIPGETGSTYTLTTDDIDATVKALVTATNTGGAAAVASAPTAVVTATPPAVSIAPAVVGPALDGETVTADPGIWSGTAPVTYEYQWLRCDLDGTGCVEIPDATDDEYTLTSADADHGIRVEVTATNAAGSVTAVSPVAAVDAAAPQNTAVPTVSGSYVDGQTLTADDGDWSGTTPLAFEYQWLRCNADGTGCQLIPGATASTHTLTADDVDHQVVVSVEATNSAGSAQAESAPRAAPVAADPPQSTTPPAVTGVLEDGATLAAGAGGWTGTEPLTITYQWQRCDAGGASCEDIDGATDPTYTLTADDVAGTVRVVVTASNDAGEDTSTSPATETIALAPPATTTPPVVTGSPADGETLTADPGAWTGTGPIDFTYQWQRCADDGTPCVDIPGATEETYTLGTDDIGSTVRVVVTGDNGEQTEVPSTAVGPIAALPPASTSVPAVSGTVADGETLTAGDGGWDGSLPLTLTYQWQRCADDGTACVDITGAEDPTYALTGADVGHAIRVEVTATNSAGDDTAVSAPTAATLPAPPVNTTQPPAPTGTGVDGGTLTAAPGAWTGDGTIIYTYQWQRCDDDGTDCEDIDGATDETYSPTAGDVGHAIVVEVTATNPGGSSTEASAPTATPILANPPVNTIAPTIAGIPADGATLTAGLGTWSGTPTITYEHQWQRCADDGTACADIDGATDATYSPTGADAGHAIVVVVTATNAGGPVAAASAPTDVVTAEPPVNTAPPSVTGTAADGGTLTADPGAWTGTLPIIYEYQWQRCADDGTACVDITGATDDTYSPTAADVGHPIVVVVTATNPGDSATQASAPTAATLPAPPVNTTQPPAPTGTGVDGGTLTAAPGAWSGDGTIIYTYQWQACDADGTDCEDIDGATEETYSPTAGDVGHAIVVEVTATNPGGSSTEASAPTAAPVTAAPPVNTVPPSMTGDPADGATLTADPGTWTGTPTIDFEYQWQRCDSDGANCEDIDGETGDTYTPGPGDIGHTIIVVVTATNAGGEATEAASETTELVVASPPHDTVAPVVTGDADLGETLTAGTGTWTGTAPVAFEHQWQRCADDGTACVDIDGATDETYTIGEDDQGHTIVVVVTAENGAGSDTSTSAPSAVVPAPPANTVVPTISGDEEVGTTLTADPGTWTGTGTLAYTYQWQRCDSTGNDCEAITGATDETYTLTDDDIGHMITVIVTATNDVDDADAGAQPTPAVQPAPKATPTPTPTATPTPTPTATPNATPAAPRPSTSALPATQGGGADSLLGDLGSVAGSFVSDTNCQQLAGNAKYRRLKLRGIGTVRVRAYTAGPATALTPILVTTQISHGKAKSVRYTIDGRRLRVGRKPRYNAAITPSLLQRIGVHKLKAMVTGKGKRKRAKPIVLKLKTVSCRTLFTAQRWRTTAGAGLRLRIDARTALDRLAFKVPAALLPRQTTKRRTVGFMRVFVAGQSKRKRYALKLAKKGRGKYLVKAAGKPAVRYVRGGLEVRGLPARSAVAEITLYRVTKRDGATRRKRYRLKASVMRPGARALSMSVRPRAPR